ncbi:MAG: hypothetical protein FJ197_00405 [Gammaproteobacteria bacterium]|nr:hypothetical protein [Gammaproteobacteria bacterium]
MRRGDLVGRVNLAAVPLRSGDSLFLQCSAAEIETLGGSGEFEDAREIGETELRGTYRLQERLFAVRVPRDSALGGQRLVVFAVAMTLTALFWPLR